MIYREGDWIIDNESGRLGTVSKVFHSGITARFGEAVAIRKNENITLAPLDIREEDLLSMQYLAVEMDDREWFQQLAQRMGVEMYGQITGD
jgi:hypothetical protein